MFAIVLVYWDGSNKIIIDRPFPYSAIKWQLYYVK